MKTTTPPQRAIWDWLLSLLAIGFGLLTLREGGAVLFFDGAARQAAGHYVPFVLWFNFLAGFAYVVAGVGVHVLLGGAWDPRTPVAMTLRTLVWAGIASLAWRRSAANALTEREH